MTDLEKSDFQKVENNIQQPVKKVRDSNIELLRCIIMFWITFYHLNCHGFRVLGSDSSLDFNNLIIKGVSSFNGLSNLIFLMISGYFLVNAKFSWKKVLKLWFQCFFFSVLLGVPLYILKIPCLPGKGIELRIMEIKDLIKVFIPILSSNTWFTTYYLFFYILSPFISILIKNIDKKQHFLLICITIFVGSILPSFISPYNFSRLYYFIMVFLIASYIRLYNPSIMNKQKYCILGFILGVLLFIAGYYICHFIIGGKSFSRIKGMTRFPMLFIAICVFCIFKNLKLKYIPFINKISACTLSVYLLHDNRFYCFIWEKIFHIPSLRYSKFYLPASICIALTIFTIAVCIELLRKRFIEKPFLSAVDKVSIKKES